MSMEGALPMTDIASCPVTLYMHLTVIPVMALERVA